LLTLCLSRSAKPTWTVPALRVLSMVSAVPITGWSWGPGPGRIRSDRRIAIPQVYRRMIPPLDDDGYLPPGIHSADLDEIETRFGRESELRQVEMESIRWLVDLARRAGVQRIVINGSFVTAVLEPNDVDCALLIGPGFPRDAKAEEELIEGLPFLDTHLVRRDG
jgi:hypothetical protein